MRRRSKPRKRRISESRKSPTPVTPWGAASPRSSRDCVPTSAPWLQADQLDRNGTYANIRNVRSWFEPAAVAGSIGQTFHMPVSTYPIIPDAVESVASVLFGAAFAPPAPGMTTLPLDYQATLHAVISANWQ